MPNSPLKKAHSTRQLVGLELPQKPRHHASPSNQQQEVELLRVGSLLNVKNSIQKPCRFCGDLTHIYVKVQPNIYWVKRYECDQPTCKFMRKDMERIAGNICETLSAPNPILN